MSDEKSFFDMSSKQGLVMGLALGIAVVSLIGFFVLLANQPEDTGNGDVAGANVNSNSNTNAAPTPTPTPTPPPATGDISKLNSILDGTYSKGPGNAKVTLIEVSEFQCPYCARHNPTMEQIMEEYKGQVRRVWIHFPLTSIHPNAQKASEAVECAGEQNPDKFWELHDKLFENQSAIAVGDIKGYAQEIGLNTAKFNECLDTGKYTAKVQQQAQAAQSAGISGTPGTFVNGELVKGAYPVETFEQIIDGILGE